MSSVASPSGSRTAARVAGLALLGMTLLGVYSEFLTLQQLHVPGDATATAGNVLDSTPAFRAGVLALLGIIVLDVIVAWGLYEYLRPVHCGLALLTAWLRIVYAGILGVALAQLVELLTRLGEELPASDLLSMDGGAFILAHIDAYYAIWGLGLIVFGLHLGALGLLVVRSGYVPKLFGFLLGLAGLGYAAEYGARVLWSDFSVPLSRAGWAEPLFILWLLWAGRPTRSGRSEGVP